MTSSGPSRASQASPDPARGEARTDADPSTGAADPSTGERTPTQVSKQLAHEQEHVDEVYRRLDELREHVGSRLANVRRAPRGGTHQNRSERDAFATLYEDRLAQLNAVEDRLVFGRMDLKNSDRQYIGRLGLSDRSHQPLLTDWRAPAARAFYQATAAHPGQVVLRRHLQTRQRQVIGIEDDLLDADSIDEDVVLAGEGALLAALNAERTGHMSDIVATIQAEQDAIIRSDLNGVLVVEGAPGTGKTAVALHRAAYLLYAYREQILRSGVLVVGPSRAFLRYIEQVLPALGETGVVSTTIGDLIPGIEAKTVESPEVAELKGRPIWARIIANAVRARQRILPERDLAVGSIRLRLRTSDMEEARSRARRSHQKHNQARVTFVRHMLAALAHQYSEEIGSGSAEHAEIISELRSCRDVRVALNLCWMPLTAQGLLADLFAKPHRLAEAAPRLTKHERDLLLREKGADWTQSDIPLLDEIAELIGDEDEASRVQDAAAAAQHEREVAYAQEMLSQSGLGGGLVSAAGIAERFAPGQTSLSTAERAGLDRSWTYGHIVVDEAQELSAMAWRALLRRNPRRSMTIVGDVWQTASSAGASDWAEMLQRPLHGAFRSAKLSVNYRTPASIMELAQHAMRSWNPALPELSVSSARDVEGAIRRVHSANLAAGLADILEQSLASGGTTAVIAHVVADNEIAAVVKRAAESQPSPHSEPSVVLLTAEESKGLEFDHVVLVEPTAILDGGPAANLYVAMTRATQRLYLLYTDQLPAALVSGD